MLFFLLYTFCFVGMLILFSLSFSLCFSLNVYMNIHKDVLFFNMVHRLCSILCFAIHLTQKFELYSKTNSYQNTYSYIHSIRTITLKPRKVPQI